MPRRADGIKSVNISPNDPCICGSGKATAACHLDTDGRFRIKTGPRHPRPPLTGYQHPKCCLSITRDCSEKISREHYISEALLKQLGTMLRIDGVPWLAAGESFEAPPSALTAKILCKRHNESLSDLDEQASDFFSELREAFIDLDKKTLSRKPIFHLANGYALELWMLKVAVGVYHSIASKDGKKVTDFYSIDMEKVVASLYFDFWDSPGGLYLAANVGSDVELNDKLSCAPLGFNGQSSYAGVRVSFHGLIFDLIFNSTDALHGAMSASTHRPSELVFAKKGRQHSIILTWPPNTPETSLTFHSKTSSSR